MDLSEQGPGGRHPWEIVRAEFFRLLVSECVDTSRPLRILDIGAGDGWFAHELLNSLAAGSQVVCWDINYVDGDLASPLPAGLSRMVEPPTSTFDLVLLLDVIEHVEDDISFLREEVAPRLTEDAVLVVSVPAYQALFSAHDVALRHHRRYTPERLRTVLSGQFSVCRRGGLFTTLLPVRAATVLAERRREGSKAHGIGQWSGGRSLTWAVTACLSLDARTNAWLSRHGLRAPGLSTWAVCQRTEASHDE